MDKIIKFRKNRARRVLIVTIIAAAVLTMLNLERVRQVVSVFKTNSSPLVESYDELDRVGVVGKTLRMEVPYMSDSGITYGTDKRSELSYSFTNFDDVYIVVLQEGDVKDMSLFEESQVKLFTVIDDRNSSTALSMLIEDFAGEFDLSVEEAELYFHPYVLRLEGVRSNTYIYLIALSAILILGIGFYLYRSSKALKDLVKAFSAEEMDRIDYEIKSRIYESKNVILTNTYLIRLKTLSVPKQFIRVEDIAWAYKGVTTHRTNGIKTGTTYQLNVYINGSRAPHIIAMSEQEVEELLELLDSSSEHILVGFYEGAVQVWNNSLNYNDFMEALRAE